MLKAWLMKNIGTNDLDNTRAKLYAELFHSTRLFTCAQMERRWLRKEEMQRVYERKVEGLRETQENAAMGLNDYNTNETRNEGSAIYSGLR